MGEEGKDEARPGRLVFTYIVIPGYPYFDVFSGLIGGMVDECIAVTGMAGEREEEGELEATGIRWRLVTK